ncbi:MAG: rod shape-determining protein MreC [Gammaproteobacteria bacterium]|nr:rod shape-determining protein MreC [Gammaproteobacteria bacterium]
MALSSADSEGRAYRNASPNLRFFLAGACSLALMFLDHRGTYLEEVRAYLGAAMYPLQVAINSPATGARWMRENMALRERLITENAALRRDALATSAELQRLAALQAENARFRALLDSRTRVPDRVVVGEILAVDMDPLRHRVILNKGGRDGAYEGQALIDASGVVGQITRDQQDSAEALLITDPDHAVPVEIVRNGLRTIAMGTGDLKRLSLPFLTRNADIKPGDLLVTSGLGGAFPAGYPVGTVTTVDGSSGDAFLDVAAKPAASLDRLHEVLLVFQQRGAAASAAAGTASTPASAMPVAPASKAASPPASAPPATAGTPAATPAPAVPDVPAAPAASPPAEAVPTAPGPSVGEQPATVTTPVVEPVPNEDTTLVTTPTGTNVPAPAPETAPPDEAGAGAATTDAGQEGATE